MHIPRSRWPKRSATVKRVRRLPSSSAQRTICFSCFLALVALPAASAFAQAPASITGVVRDTAGSAITDVEVVLRDQPRATRTNPRGEFTIADIPPGNYRVWFRRLGFVSVEYNWAARAGEKIELNVVMHHVPRTLDPVVVRAEEDRIATIRSSILGLVIDSEGKPIDEAEVQLIGANMSGLTRENGGFLFKPLNVGAYVVRVRKIGYEPSMVTLQLTKSDDREVVIRLKPLATGLDPVVVTERSGYGRDQVAYDELERRKRWVNFQSRFVGPEDLKNMYGVGLETAMVRLGFRPSDLATNGRGRAMSIDPRGTSRGHSFSVAGDACILLNGKDPVIQPLDTFTANDVELLEVYPGGTDLTGTVGWHFRREPCVGSPTRHPTYYVLWLKGR